jgi:hypothetical protein
MQWTGDAGWNLATGCGTGALMCRTIFLLCDRTNSRIF